MRPGSLCGDCAHPHSGQRPCEEILESPAKASTSRHKLRGNSSKLFSLAEVWIHFFAFSKIFGPKIFGPFPQSPLQIRLRIAYMVITFDIENDEDAGMLVPSQSLAPFLERSFFTALESKLMGNKEDNLGRMGHGILAALIKVRASWDGPVVKKNIPPIVATDSNKVFCHLAHLVAQGPRKGKHDLPNIGAMTLHFFPRFLRGLSL